MPYWDIPTLAGAGALRSTANDMLTFLAANLDSMGGPLHRALAATHAARRETGTPGLSVGLGWHVCEVEGRQIVWHNGGTGGFRSFIGFDESRRAGVIVLANSAGDVDDIGYHLLEPLSPLASTPVAREEITLAPGVLDAFVGVYELTPEFRIPSPGTAARCSSRRRDSRGSRSMPSPRPISSSRRSTPRSPSYGSRAGR